jgi:hypothetical protein
MAEFLQGMNRADTALLARRLVGWLLLLVLLVLLLLRPALRDLADAQRSLSEAREDQALAELVQPVMMRIEQAAAIQVPANLALPPPGKLIQERIPELYTMFQDLADKHGLQQLRAEPQVTSLVDGFEYLLVNVRLLGDMESLHKYLAGLNQVPCLAGVEYLRLETVGLQREFELKVWLTIE